MASKSARQKFATYVAIAPQCFMVPVDCDFRAIPLIKRRRMYELSPQNRTKMFHESPATDGEPILPLTRIDIIQSYWFRTGHATGSSPGLTFKRRAVQWRGRRGE
jgi:hypothetical protein